MVRQLGSTRRKAAHLNTDGGAQACDPKVILLVLFLLLHTREAWAAQGDGSMGAGLLQPDESEPPIPVRNVHGKLLIEKGRARFS